jgi:uncharacterized protein (DUF924 family)
MSLSIYTKEGVEARGYDFIYHEYYGRVVKVSIVQRESRAHVYSHFHTQGVIDAFNRLPHGRRGRMTAEQEAAYLTEKGA